MALFVFGRKDETSQDRKITIIIEAENVDEAERLRKEATDYSENWYLIQG